jgi:hypothetical protein
LLVYLTGVPVSMKKLKGSLDLAPQTRESLHLALIARADALHAEAVHGFSRAAKGLRVRRHVSQLRTVKGGSYCCLVWVYLSDGSRFRCAWLLESPVGALYPVWCRIPWERLRFRSDVAPRKPA